ncbi:expressed unknown protein [Seminavis robusta]|uniref:Uncharacterized protein n=1 Tax=Seminavis robusta TaxID=568900 RepID=A0A9N8HRA4_9STRA|nr:expressed unknown protein [Seminavis robusta]|eukprot:Sro1545_g281280.1 n/a (171) ;mRNA; r:5269-5781
MKLVYCLSLLFASAVCSVSAAGVDRELQLPDFSVTVTGVSGQSISFDTGEGGGSKPNIKIRVADLCRNESPQRAEVGYLFPGSSVPGIQSNTSGVVNNPGAGNTISFSFLEGISQNYHIYTAASGNTATVSFCVEIGMYAETMLVDFEEVKVTYNVNLATKAGTLTSHTP